MNLLKRVDEGAALIPVVEPLARALTDEHPRTRRYAAVALAALVPKVKDETTLRRAVPLLTAARSKDPDPKVREYVRRALSNASHRLEQKKPQPRTHSF
jgi:HEAT repeat protein